MSHKSKPITKQKDHFRTLTKQSDLTAEFTAAYNEMRKTNSVAKALEVQKLGNALLALEEETGVKMSPQTLHKRLIADDIIHKGVDNTIKARSGYVREVGKDGKIRMVFKSQWSRS